MAKTSYGIEIDNFKITLGQIFRKKKFWVEKNILDLSHRDNRQKRQKWLKMTFQRP